MSKKIFGETLNIGSNTSISIENLAKKIMKILKVNLKIKVSKKRVRPKASEVDILKCDNTKITKFTKWKSKTNLETGLIKTIEWHKNYNSTLDKDQYF